MQRNGPTVDELLRDSLIQAVMRADRVEPEVLRSLLAHAAAGLARRAEDRNVSGARAPKAPIDRRPPPRAANANAAARLRSTAPGEPCCVGLCS